jgi:hypothetical protein
MKAASNNLFNECIVSLGAEEDIYKHLLTVDYFASTI